MSGIIENNINLQKSSLRRKNIIVQSCSQTANYIKVKDENKGSNWRRYIRQVTVGKMTFRIPT